MNPVSAENEIAVSNFGLDYGGIFRFLYEKLLGGDWNAFLDTLGFWWNVYSVIAILLSLIFFAGFVYAKIRYEQLRDVEDGALHEAEKQWAKKHNTATAKNSRWNAIQERIAGHNPESWKIAIIEADILLDETLSKAGYTGLSIGEKLKTANAQSFTTVQDAWEAHKIRNQIAHAGSDFILTQKIAKETLIRFERVFREFGVI